MKPIPALVVRASGSAPCVSAGDRVAGFTLLEVVAVLIILGMLALSGTSFVRQPAIAVYVERDALVARLLYARGLGMAYGGGVCLTVRTESGRTTQLLTHEQDTDAAQTTQTGSVETGAGRRAMAVLLAYPGEVAPYVMPENLSVHGDEAGGTGGTGGTGGLRFCFDAFGRRCPREAMRAEEPGGSLHCTAAQTPTGQPAYVTLSIRENGENGETGQRVRLFNETGLLQRVEPTHATGARL